MTITFKRAMNIADTMIFENEYHENLQFDLEEKIELLMDAICVWMFIDNKLVGESYGIPFDKLDEPIQGCENYIGSDATIYCYSNTIIKDFQKQGFGNILKSNWLGLVTGCNFKKVVGHARPGGSQALNIKFGATLEDTFSNWYNTGEDYRMYVLNL